MGRKEKRQKKKQREHDLAAEEQQIDVPNADADADTVVNNEEKLLPDDQEIPAPGMENLEDFSAVVDQTVYSSPTDLVLDDFSIHAHKLQLFTGASLRVPFGQRVGFVGRNGLGKTTLLKYIATRMLPVHPKMDLLYVEQEVVGSQQTVVETILSANSHRISLLRKAARLGKLLGIADANGEGDNENNENDANPDLMDRYLEEYQSVQEELVAIGADRDEAIVRKLCAGLGFSRQAQDQPTQIFSGGWRMRISLARALYLKPTLLLLDEPTNHLDLNATIWLTDYLSNHWTNSLLVVSHNQDFLTRVCTGIVQIERGGKIASYRGNYQQFIKSYRDKLRTAEKQWEKTEKEVARMRKKSLPKAKVQEYLKKQAELGIIRPEREYEVNIHFHPVAELSHPVIEVYGVDFRYGGTCDDDVGPMLFKGLEFGIGLETRAVIVGPNGVGKSTLINLLVGQLQPLRGEIRRKHILRIGYYNQHFVEFLPLEQTPIEYLQHVSILEEESNQTQIIRSYLGRIGLEGRTHTMPIGKLSGGQKARVALISLYVQKPHLIFLDEPTNHLDIESINGLIQAINEFNGGIVMVSHDVRLITETDAELWVCQDGKLTPYAGEYKDYHDEILEDLLAEDADSG